MSAQAAQSASARPLPKVLRIGVVVEGKIATERLIRIGETVTIGESPRNTFPISGTNIGERFEMFVPKGEGYVLAAPEFVEGKISWKDGIRGLDEIRARGEAQKRGDTWIYPLNENVRGKVTVGSHTILFQFVPAPPEPIRQISAADFRPRYIDSDDPLFTGLLGVFSVIALAFMTWVYVTPLPERSEAELVRNAVELTVDNPLPPPPPPEETPKDDGATDKPVEDKPPEEAPPEEAPAPAANPAERPTEKSVEQRSMLLQMLGSAAADGSAGAVADIVGDDSAQMAGLDAALQGVSGAQIAEAGSVGIKGGSANGATDAKITGTGIVAGKGAAVNTGTAVKVKRPVVETGTVEADVMEGDAGSIQTVVRKNSGRINSCVEQALKANPDLKGRVSVGWSIQAGKVSGAQLKSNTTGDSTLGECVVRAVRGMRFDEALTADVAEFPFAVSGQ